MDFGDAIRALKDGKRVAREGWNGKGMYIFLACATELVSTHGAPVERLSNVRPCFVMKDVQGMLVPGWLASQTDMLAEDWQIVA